MKNSFQISAFRFQQMRKRFGFLLKADSWQLKARQGFTLVETLVAVMLLSIAIVAPMLLTVRSLSSAYYAKDQFTAFYLAQEGIESVHQIRDNQILEIAGGATDVDLFGSITNYTNSEPFKIDATTNDITACPLAGCPPLESNGNLYGYGDTGWTPTNFTRTITACYVQSPSGCNSTRSDEMRVSVTVSWKTASLASRSFTISEDLYRWLDDN